MNHKNYSAFANFMGNHKWNNMVTGTQRPMAYQGRSVIYNPPVSGTPSGPQGPTRGPVTGPYSPPTTPLPPGPSYPQGTKGSGTGIPAGHTSGNGTSTGSGSTVGTQKMKSCNACQNGYPVGVAYIPFNQPCPPGSSSVPDPCKGQIIYGCMDPTADNYNALATHDDASCIFPSNVVYGCTSENAENYDPAANIDNGSCTFSSSNVYGCTNPIADNFNSEATVDNGSCEFSARYGCTDESAANYDENATDEDYSCTYSVKYGCTDVQADNFDSYATNDDNSCDYTMSGGTPPIVGGGGGYPAPYGVGGGEIFPPIDSGIYQPGGPGQAVRDVEGDKEDMFKKYWWVLLLLAGGYYMYTQNKNKNQ